MSDLPTLVFVPGAWHKPACFDKIIELLRVQSKLRCVSVTLPSTQGNPKATFKDDLDAAQGAIHNETAQGRDVVLIAHSYGGMVANSAINGFARPRESPSSQTRHPTTGSILGLILIASGFTLTGLSFMDPFFGRPPPFWRVNDSTGYAELVASPRELFYHDLPAEEAEFWVSQLTTQSLKSLFEGGEFSYAGWKDVPVWYIGTVEDRGLPILVQRMQIGMAREMGAIVEHRELQTSHSPFLSQPEATSSIIIEATNAFSRTLGQKASTPNGHGLAIVSPKATLFKPFTWFKFGLPLIFGHILGRTFLLFTWGRRLWSSTSS